MFTVTVHTETGRKYSYDEPTLEAARGLVGMMITDGRYASWYEASKAASKMKVDSTIGLAGRSWTITRKVEQ